MEGITQKRICASILGLALVVTSGWAQEAPKPAETPKPAEGAKPAKQAKDQAEFDLIQAVNKEAPGPKKIELLQQWEQKYPETAFKEERAATLCQTYQQMQKPAEMWVGCKKLYDVNPKNPMALFFLSQLALSLNDPSKFDEGIKITKELLAVIPTLPISDTDKKAQEVVARKNLGNLSMAKKDYVQAENVFTEFLQWNPNSGAVSYSLANAMLLQKNKEKQQPALWHLARSAYYTGDDALPDATKKQLQAFLEKTYVAYHGSKGGMQEVIDAALKNPFPPADFKILSSYEQDEKDMEELKASNEMMYNWVQMKRGLTGPQSGEYWAQMKDTAIATKFKGTVISSNPPTKTTELIVGIRDANNPEIKMTLESPVGKVEPGTVIEFENMVVKDFTPDPFLLTVEIENDKVTGLPAAVGPRRPGAKKAGGKKK